MAYTMTVVVEAGLSADGFSVTVFSDGVQEESKYYRYGYNASWDKAAATKDKPFVRDVISSYRDKYQPWEIEILPGENTFTGLPVDLATVERFVRNYID